MSTGLLWITCWTFLAALLCKQSDAQATVADVSAQIQFATVMRSEDYVYNNGTIGAFPSLFIGLFHMSVQPGPGAGYTMKTLVWHQVDFATQIEMRVAAIGIANTELLPAFVIASGPLAVPSECPIFRTFVIDDFFYKSLLAGDVYVQILADQPAGLLRGQLYSRRDVLVAFPSLTPFTGTQYTATAGMAIVYAEPAQPGFVTVTHWILSRFAAPMVWNANNGFSNFTTAIIFGPVPVTQTTGVTLTITPTGAVPIVAPLGLVFTARMAGQPGATGPISGPGSSNMVLTRQGNFIEETFSDFIRLAYYEDWLFPNSTTSAGAILTPTLIVSASVSVIASLWLGVEVDDISNVATMIITKQYH